MVLPNVITCTLGLDNLVHWGLGSCASCSRDLHLCNRKLFRLCYPHSEITQEALTPMTTYTNSNEAIEKLAATIGENVYIDVAKWHLYLRDAHLHTTLAEQLYPLMMKGSVSEDQVLALLKQISIKLGGGKLDVTLADLLPMQSQVHLMDAIEEFQRDL